jgi:hypothetical protein
MKEGEETKRKFTMQGRELIILHNRVIREVTSPCFHPGFGPAFTSNPLSQWYPQSNEILLNLSMKCSNSAFNGQRSRVIIVVVLAGAVKIYLVEALRKKER